jgi:transcriptional regulator with XRE-family HTH domain
MQQERTGMHVLKELRRERAMTQEELAAAVGVHQGTIARLETGGRSPRASTIRKLAAALGVPVMTLTKCGPALAEGAVR